MAFRKNNNVNVEFEAKVMDLLKGELKRKGVTFAQLAEKLTEKGIPENERNLKYKIGRGKFSAAFFLECLEAAEVENLALK